jgi:CBS domain-containing protein
MKLREALKKVSHFKFRCYPVLYKDKLVGAVELQDLLGAPEEDLDRNIILYVKDPIYVTMDQPLEEIIEKMLSLDADHVFVVDEEWKLLGLISDRDIIRFLLGKYARYYK